MRIKSQCILLRASVEQFEKNKKSNGMINEHEETFRILNSTRTAMNRDDGQLKFYQMLVKQLEFDQSSDSNAMQQD